MALSEQMESALNDQITCELGASLTYLQMAAHLEGDDRPGMATWMAGSRRKRRPTPECSSISSWRVTGRVEIGEIPAPVSKFDSPVHVFEEALRHERAVTGRIRALYELATDINDLESLPFLQTFLAEQVEEESVVGGICERLRRVEGNEVGLALIEHELSTRSAEEE